MTDTRPSQIDAARLAELHRRMCRVRAFEEAAEQAARDGLVTGAVHVSIGQEAVAVGVCAHLKPGDKVTSTHRGHGHCLMMGADPLAMMRELLGRAGGVCGGKGGSMHIADFAAGMLGANGVVADGIPIAVGAAHGLKVAGQPGIVACFFGDGAVNRGPFLEGLNWARIFDLPVLFVCEDNGYAATTRTRTMTGGPGIAARAEALGVAARAVDGNDVVAVDDLAGELAAAVRRGGGPRLLVARTYRLRGHTHADAGAYRPAEEVAAAWARDPLALARESLIRAGQEPAELDAARAEIAAILEAAKASPHPPPEAAFADVQDLGAVTP